MLLQGACAEDGAPLGFSAAGLPSLPAGQQLEVPPPTAGGGHRLEGELANCVQQLLEACSTAHGGGEQLRALAEGSQDSGRPSTTRGADEASRGSAVEGKRSPHLSLAAVVPTLMSAAELPNRSPSFEATLRRRRVGELVHEAAALSSSRSRSGSTPASHSWLAPALPPAWSAPSAVDAAAAGLENGDTIATRPCGDATPSSKAPLTTNPPSDRALGPFLKEAWGGGPDATTPDPPRSCASAAGFDDGAAPAVRGDDSSISERAGLFEDGAGGMGSSAEAGGPLFTKGGHDVGAVQPRAVPMSSPGLGSVDEEGVGAPASEAITPSARQPRRAAPRSAASSGEAPRSARTGGEPPRSARTAAGTAEPAQRSARGGDVSTRSARSAKSKDDKRAMGRKPSASKSSAGKSSAASTCS